MSQSELLEDIFTAAARLRDPSKRAAYLVSACAGNDALRQQVEALLGEHADSRAGTARFFAGILTASEVGEQPGDQVGMYRLVRRIGEGGFGVVFEAEQRAPLRRRVALKILKAGLDTRQILLRFQQEQQTLALLDHSNIARVLDAGGTPAGRPYFVMELIEGSAITTFCDEHRLSVRERLRLFAKVCRAVHHAHQKGIIHRDLKPSNILVNPAHDVPEPKVIDFGIAKATRGGLAGETVHTHWHQLLGTPAYMSPEQTLAGERDVDTRSDIYSLGVLLSELLTGVTPGQTGAETGSGHRRQSMRGQLVVRPSSQLSRLPAASQEKAAALRRCPARELSRSIQGDLDWIVVKATDQEPDRRYESADALALDLERFLDHRPVEARPPSVAYLAGRFIRRHRWWVAGAVAILAALIAGGGAAVWGWWVAKRESRIAHEQSEYARQLNDILFLGLLRADPGQGRGTDYTVREFLDELGRDVDRRTDMTPEVECSLRDMLSYIYRETGDYRNALHHAQRGLEQARQLTANPRRLASFLMTLGEVYKEMDRFEDAARYLKECIGVRQDIFGHDHPQVLRTRLSLGRVQYQAGDREDGLTLVSDALTKARQQAGEPWGTDQLIRSLNMMELLLRDEHRWEEAARLNRERLELTRRHKGKSHPATLLAQTHLGRLLTQMNRLDEAREILTGTLEQARRQLGDHYPFTLETMIALADCEARRGGTDRAAALYDEAIERSEKRYGAGYPDRLEWIRSAIQCNEVLQRSGRAAELRLLLPRPPLEAP